MGVGGVLHEGGFIEHPLPWVLLDGPWLGGLGLAKEPVRLLALTGKILHPAIRALLLLQWLEGGDEVILGMPLGVFRAWVFPYPKAACGEVLSEGHLLRGEHERRL